MSNIAKQPIFKNNNLTHTSSTTQKLDPQQENDKLNKQIAKLKNKVHKQKIEIENQENEIKNMSVWYNDYTQQFISYQKIAILLTAGMDEKEVIDNIDNNYHLFYCVCNLGNIHAASWMMNTYQNELKKNEVIHEMILMLSDIEILEGKKNPSIIKWLNRQYKLEPKPEQLSV